MFARHFRPRQFLGSVYGTEPFRDFCDRASDDELGRLVGLEPARAREAA